MADDTSQNEYEITYLIDPQLEEDARGELNGAIDEKITELSGSIEHSTGSTRQRLGYAINNKHTAFRRMTHVHLDPEKLGEFRQFLKKTDGVARSMILRTPRREEVPADIFQTKEKEQAVAPPATSDEKATPKKKVTMEEVEKGIEEALSEEVK